jgi:hypothetical protein
MWQRQKVQEVLLAVADPEKGEQLNKYLSDV